MKFFNEKPESSSQEKVLDIKTLLKLARKYIDENNTRQAQQCCKKVLRKNSQNYMAHVLLGKSYGKSDEALQSYEKAIEIKPDNPLAWQGVAQYYETKDDEFAKTKLLSIYDKILQLNIEEDYAKKTLIKNGELGCQLKSDDTITNFIQYIKTQNNENLLATAKAQLIKLLQSNITCRDDDAPEVIDILKNLDVKDLSEDHSELVILADLIVRNNDFSFAVEEILRLHFFPGSLTMKNWLCKLICKVFLSQNSLLGFNLRKHINALIAGVEATKYGGILSSITYYTQNMYENAYQKCISVMKENLHVITELEALFLLNCSKMTPNILRTKNLCNYFLRKENLINPGFVNTLNTILLTCFMKEKDFNKVLYYLEKIPIDQINSVVLSEVGSLFLKLDVIDRMYMWDILESTAYFDLFKAIDCMKSKKYSYAIEILTSYDRHPLKYYYLGISYWFINSNDRALENFKKAAKLIPNHPKVFYCLGAHYYRWKDDIQQSVKCLEKAYSLCKTDVKVIKMLSTVYTKLGLVDIEFDVLLTAFNLPQTCEHWVCVRLASICLLRGALKEALFYLQVALKKRPREVKILEWIGDIHFNINEYDHALMAYNRILEISQDNGVFLRCLNRIGVIYSEQMMYHNAIFIFDNILNIDPSNVQALKGITENRISFALKYVADELLMNARQQMQLAFNRITTAMSRGIKDLVYWLLYADILVYITRLPNEYSYIMIRTRDGEARKGRIDMYKMATESYCNIMKFRDSSALFKCAITYFEYYCETRNIALCKTSYNLAVLYMRINPNVWPIWDLLGKISYQLNKYETAYYCFCKALSFVEDSEFKVWKDLGAFYLQLDKHQLANYRHVIDRFDLNTFAPTTKEELTNTIPNSNENSESIDDDATNAEEEDKLQFTEWIRTFQPSSSEPHEPTFDAPIESLRTVHNANDIIEWYLCFEDESAWSLCSLGKLQERKGLFNPAIRYYDRAYAIAHGKQKNEILSHKGRVLMKMREYKMAINVYTKVPERNLPDTCAFAFALYKTDDYKQSFASYKKALRDLCQSDDQRARVLTVMSNCAYRLNGLNEGAKLLLQAVSIKCEDGQIFNSTFFQSYVFKKVEIQLLAHVMSVYFHKQIDKTLWWYFMGLNYLRGIHKYAKLTRACIKRAIRGNTVSVRNGKLYALIGIAEFYAGNRQNALYYTTRALRLYPSQPELWTTFILCVNSDRTWPRKAYFLRWVISTMRRLIHITPSLNKWLTKVEIENGELPRDIE